MDRFELQDTYIGLDNVTLRKAKGEKNVVFIEASNQMTDSQGDIVLQKALEVEAENFLKSGVISWNHMHKVDKNPKYICGEPLDVAFPKTGSTLVKAKLYPHNEYGKSILDLVSDSTTRLGASVGGGIVKRANMYVGSLKKSVKAIVKVIWDEVAVTHEPVNESTLGKVSFVPFEAFAKSFILDDAERAEELQKALTAGYGTDSSSFSGGRALMSEDLAGADKKKRKKVLVDAFALVIGNIRKSKIRNFSDLVSVLKKSGMQEHSLFVSKTIVSNLNRLKNN